jgi:hypothetical protein
VDRVAPLPESGVCRHGGCRYDQSFTSIDAHGTTPAAMIALVEEDPSNPHAWAGYGEYLASTGQTAAAQHAFARALALGPGLAPVLMRAANFDFTHERSAEGLSLVPRILSQTAEYDEILFSYLQLSGLGATQLLDQAIPASPREARSWLRWTLTHASTADIVTTAAWLQCRGLTNQQSATDTVNALWQRAAYGEAQQVWLAWLGTAAGEYPRTQLLANPLFEREPGATPLDWDLSPRTGLEYSRRDGLEVRFLGQDNVTDAGVRQYAVVSPGRYRLTADVSAEDITTNEGVFFRVTDAENPARLSAQTAPFLGTQARAITTLEVIVPAGTHVVRVELARKSSLKFDNKLAGTLRIHRLALERQAAGSQFTSHN